MKLLKKSLILKSFALIFVLAVTFVFSGFINNRQSLAIRSVNVNEIGTLSYEEKAEKLKEQFSSINTGEDNNSYYFCGEINIDAYNLLSTNYEGQEVKEKYYSTIDKSDESITIEKDVVVNNEVKSTILENYTTRYDEQTEKYYLIDENGNEIDIFAELEDDNVNECFALTMFLISLSLKEIITVCVVTAISIVVIANADTIANDINSLVSGVRDGFVSFWDKIKLALGKITAVALTSAIAILTFAQAERIYKEANKRRDCYLLLAPISQKEPISILYKFANLANARNWIKKGGSVWSPYSTTTKTAIKEAGFSAGGTTGGNVYVVNLKEHHSSDLGLPTFDHYHTIIGSKRVNHSCHGFFGLPYYA